MKILLKNITTQLGLGLILFLPGCQASAQEDATDPEKLEQQAAEGMRSGNYAAATDALESLIKHDDKRVEYFLTLGDARFMNAEMRESIAAYDRAIELDADLGPRCWQRGLALYFADEFEKGKQQFESHQTVNRQDVENSVWHLLCHAKVVGLKKARESMIPISGDPRVPMPEVFKLFAGDGSVEEVLEAARSPSDRRRNRDAYMYYAHIYTGLYQEMTGEAGQALESMKKAVEINPIPKSSLMGSIADVFLKLRDPDNRN